MRYTLIVLLVWATAGATKAQLQFDNTWIMGYSPNNPDEYHGGTSITFDKNNMSAMFFETIAEVNTNASISDTSGYLLFYIDGCALYNRQHQEMFNGIGLNPGFKYDQDCLAGLGYITHQGSLILSSTKKKNEYYVFHMGIPDIDFITKDFYYTVVVGSPKTVQFKSRGNY